MVRLKNWIIHIALARGGETHSVFPTSSSLLKGRVRVPKKLSRSMVAGPHRGVSHRERTGGFVNTHLTKIAQLDHQSILFGQPSQRSMQPLDPLCLFALDVWAGGGICEAPG